MIDPFEALRSHNINELNSYLEHGNVNILDSHKRSLLHYAIQLKVTEAVSILLHSYIDLDLADDKGNTCFHYAVLYNGLGYLRVLFQMTGNPMTRNLALQTPLYLACRYGREDMIDLYLEKYKLDMGEKDAKEETIFLALLRAKKPHLIKKYGGFETWLEEPNYLGNTPLMIASEKNNAAMVQFLLDHSVFINQRNHFKESALFFAVRGKHKEIIDLLLKNGAFFDFKNKESQTIEEVASKEIKEFLLERRMNDQVASYKKRFPLHYAIYMEDPVLIQTYMNLKNLKREDDFGYSPKRLAELYHNKKALEHLKKLEREARIAVLKTK
ncbi:MAG: ankyrin repeat domain-containing protein [Anaeroplasmataceae bacterium]|nr:ankyrin repeat domain-containing protein [Anaeroplasmataceae bacterium]